MGVHGPKERVLANGVYAGPSYGPAWSWQHSFPRNEQRPAIVILKVVVVARPEILHAAKTVFAEAVPDRVHIGGAPSPQLYYRLRVSHHLDTQNAYSLCVPFTGS